MFADPAIHPILPQMHQHCTSTFFRCTNKAWQWRHLPTLELLTNRQPEFTQLDMEMAFMDETAIMMLAEELVVAVFREVCNGSRSIKTPPSPFPFYIAVQKPVCIFHFNACWQGVEYVLRNYFAGQVMLAAATCEPALWTSAGGKHQAGICNVD